MIILEKSINTNIFLHIINICAEFSLELSRTIAGGTKIQREVTEKVRVTSKVSTHHEKKWPPFFSAVFHYNFRIYYSCIFYD